MTDRPLTGGADTAVGPAPGYYPDPSIPGFVRYWGGSAWVPGTSRPAPAEGEVLEPPRFVARRGGAAGGGGGAGGAGRAGAGAGSGAGAGPGVGVGARFVPPPVAPEAAAMPAAEALADSGPERVPERAPGAPTGDTGPVYLDQTAGGASFAVGSQLAAGPVFRGAAAEGAGAAGSGSSDPASASASAASASDSASGGAGSVAGAGAGLAAEPSGWQADPREQRGLVETGGSQRWVSWGVLPTAQPSPDAVGGAGVGAPAEAARGAAGPAEAAGGEPPVVALRAAGAVPAQSPAPAREPEPAAAAAPVPTPAPVAAAVPTPAPVARTLAAGAGPVRSAAPESAPVPAAATVPASSREASVPTAAASAPVAPAPTALTATLADRSGVVPRPGSVDRSGAAGRPAAGSVDRSGAAPRAAARRRAAAPVPAGLGRRLAARLVDTVVLVVVATAAAVPLGNSALTHVRQKLDQARMASSLTRRQVDVWLVDGVVVGKVAVLLGILAFVGLLYEVLPTARTGQTFGKRLARIKVVAAGPAATRGRLPFGRSLVRWLVRNVSAVLLLGLVWPVFDRPARRGWHDRAAGTRVVRG